MQPLQVDLEALQFLTEVHQDLEHPLPLVVLPLLVDHQHLVVLEKYLDPLLQHLQVSSLQLDVADDPVGLQTCETLYILLCIQSAFFIHSLLPVVFLVALFPHFLLLCFLNLVLSFYFMM